MSTPTLTPPAPAPVEQTAAHDDVVAVRSDGIGRAALVVAIIGAAASVLAAIGSALLLIPQAGRIDDDLDPASRLALALGVSQVLWVGIATWGVVQGIIAAGIDRGRRAGLIAIAVGVLGPVVAGVAFVIAVLVVAPA